jgi:hypothetical protein
LAPKQGPCFWQRNDSLPSCHLINWILIHLEITYKHRDMNHRKDFQFNFNAKVFYILF